MLAGQGEQTLALLIIAQLKEKVQELVDNSYNGIKNGRDVYQTVSADGEEMKTLLYKQEESMGGS